MRPRILIIDDEQDTLKAFRRLLRHLDCDVDVAASMDDAALAIEEQAYRLIITDLRLTPAIGEEGLEILHRARAKDASTGVILITGYGNPAVMSRAHDLGAAYYLEKPVMPAQLMSAVERLCRS